MQPKLLSQSTNRRTDCFQLTLSRYKVYKNKPRNRYDKIVIKKLKINREKRRPVCDVARG